MTIYTVPALNAVDFDVNSFTPEVLIPNNIELTSYTPPASNSVDFALVSYSQLNFSSVDFELLNTTHISEVPTAAISVQSYAITAETTGEVVVVDVPGTNDGNSFSPSPKRKKKTSPVEIDVPVVNEQRVVEEVIEPAIEKIKISLKQIEQEDVDAKITQKAQEIEGFLESPRVQAAFSAISNLDRIQLQQQLSDLVDQMLLDLKQQRIENEFNDAQQLLAHKQAQMQKLQDRINLLDEVKRRHAKRKAEMEEEELALLYVLLDS